MNFEVWHKGKNRWFTLESELIKPMQHTVSRLYSRVRGVQ
jgi:hypothetical protein